MALVLMSGSLKHTILNNVSKMFEVRVSKARTKVNEDLNTRGQEIVNTLYDPKILGELSKPEYKEYIMHSREINIYTEFSLGHRYTSNITLSKSIPIPQRNRYATTRAIKEEHPAFEILKKIYQPLMDEINDRDTLYKQIKDLLGQVTTLKRLIEVWPSALEFVDSYTKERHYEVVERKKREKKVVVVDQETKTNLLKARLLV